ncbi:N-acyl-D-amino-acid deacylase family protein [Robiginitomaculum antarcticum]|uniref:N-acyl-D-amino-acid deacylase family protein n=1 Tax=Robiginitomaculum antarcticum TaxID=437507 RepID=UPI00037667DC|nr:amidohydrolase family protein [Robiginitomaculum antarcticum]
MFDILITGGSIIDGNGGEPFNADIAIKDGRIAAIGADLGEAAQSIDASGKIVTPGFIDLHTHYDGQISWDEELRPSVNHGVTTVLTGNCGVGFAPCRATDRDKLIRLMEGVEDIPGTALHEGLKWDWESFPEYMDAIDSLPHTIDFAVMVPHDPLRVFAMGDRAVFNQPANDDDIAAMRGLVREALEAGAMGLSIGRSDFHKTSDGDWTPGSEAGKDELVGIAKAFDGIDHGVLQAVNDFDMLRPGETFETEFDLMEAFFKAGAHRPGSMSLMERDFAPEDWKNIIRRTEKMNAQGLDISLQVAPRAIGSFIGLNCTFHPLMAYPSYLAIADKPLEKRVEILSDPAYKKQLLSETPIQLSGPDSPVPPMVDMMIAAFTQIAEKLFKLDYGGVVDYEQSSETSVAGLARKDAMSAWEKVYDLLLEDGGAAMIYYPVYNYYEMNYDNVLTMMRHPKALPGLSDGGAHVGTICDASFPTYLLAHWTRDRLREGKDGITLPRAVQMLTADGADYLGLSDRGRIAKGLRADINVIDYDALTLGVPEMIKDLPAGGQRLIQPVKGYTATFVSGEQVIDNDAVTTARPGRLVRGGVAA